MRSLPHEMLLARSRERMSETYIAGHSPRSALTVAMLLLAILGCIGVAQTDAEGGNLAVSIISPANGGGAPGQTLQAGVFAITNDSTFTQNVESVTISFSRPSLFSSAILKPPAGDQPVSQNISGNPLALVTISPPGASTTFSFSTPISVAPGDQSVLALEVKISPISRNESGDVRYASLLPRSRASQAAAPLWIALSFLALVTGALSDRAARRAWLLAGLVILLCIGAPGCGGDSGGPSSRQMVTLVTATHQAGVLERNPNSTVTGLPLNLGIIFGR
jgi:hypothetical protein